MSKIVPIAADDVVGLSLALIEQADSVERMLTGRPQSIVMKSRWRLTGMAHGQARCFRFLVQRARNNLHTPSDIEASDMLGVGRNTFSQMLDALEQRGVVTVRRVANVGRDIAFPAWPGLALRSRKSLAAHELRMVIRQRRTDEQIVRAKERIAEVERPKDPTIERYNETRDGPRRLWPVVAFLRQRDEQVRWFADLGRYVILGNYARLTPADLLRRANLLRAQLGREPFAADLADREDVAA